MPVSVLPAAPEPVRAAGTAMDGSCGSALPALPASSARTIQVERSLRKTAMALPGIGRGGCHYVGAGPGARC
ncbi:hypothetical protein GCM10011608_20610 [Micromonospora sonchi]|uniref:Uncharacterized protein n=1 Tax=Micromonospora sonchi TaxID=1763543 RepID=A0A917TTT5_9ACTN|nr:hypothetical protein GCM10011608_20610 [Micromonospora sonchi]